MLSVVIPAHNEAENLPRLVQEVHESLHAKLPYELVVVDDGSTDETPKVLLQLAKQYPTLRIIRHESSCGQSTALSSGVRAASYSIIATLDGDGQNDPSDIVGMLETWRSQADPSLTLIAGFRQKRNDTRWRLISSKIANGVRSRMLRDQTPDSGCGAKLFPREAFLQFPYFDHMHRFLPALMRRLGGEVVSHVVNHRPREKGSSHYGTLGRLRVGIVDLMGVAWLMHRTRVPVFVSPLSAVPLLSKKDQPMTAEQAWVGVGLFGQLMFTGRFLVQWIASERKKQSVIPHAFWYFSIGGALMLLAYAIYRQDPVFILGQSLGLLVYLRNLQLIHKPKNDSATSDLTAPATASLSLHAGDDSTEPRDERIAA